MSGAPLLLRLPNRLDALEPARVAMQAHLAPAALSLQVQFKLELVLEETFMNLLWHAFKDGTEHTIEFTVQATDDEVVLGFVDDGAPFDPTQASDPPKPVSIDDAPVGGRGLALVRRAAKTINYQRSGAHNRLQIAIATG